MATFNKFQPFAENVVEVINLGTDQLVAFLTASTPVNTNGVLADITPITTNLSSRNITTSTSSQSAGTYKLVVADLVLTASGAVTGFQYFGVYDDTPTSPADPMVCWYDHGSVVTMGSGDTFTIDFHATNGLLQLT